MWPASSITLDPATLAPGERARFWREPDFDGLECLTAAFRRHRYLPHTHETFALAAVTAGCETFVAAGTRHYLAPGAIAVVPPDTVHDGEPLDDRGFAYRTLYPSPALMAQIAADLAGSDHAEVPHFPQTVCADPVSAAALMRMHRTLEGADTHPMGREEAVVGFLAGLILRHAGDAAAPITLRREDGPVARVRRRLEAELSATPSLASLAAEVGLTRTHLMRVFRRDVGLTPHGYLMDRRFRAAARLLVAGVTPAEVAATCGFCDQSHLTRAFRQRMGVTPGVFRAAHRPLSAQAPDCC